MIDYENVSPEILREWEKEFRNKYRREMCKYLREFPDVTPKEKYDLERWVRSGHSPYDNGDYIATESGEPMDFLNARRFREDKYQAFLENPDGFRNSHEPMESVSDGNSDNGSDLPF